MKGRFAELMMMVAPTTYQKYVTIESRQKLLYLKVQKALYGMLKSALLFYKKLRVNLESVEFKLNPYNPFAADKMVNGS